MRVFDAAVGEKLGHERSFARGRVLDDDPVEVLDVDQRLSETSQLSLLDRASVSRSDGVNPGELKGN